MLRVMPTADKAEMPDEEAAADEPEQPAKRAAAS
jgi:hypothetical protein